MSNVYFVESLRVVVGICSSLDRAMELVEGKEVDGTMITEIPINKMVSTEKLEDYLGVLNHWHWDEDEREWTG